MTVQILGAPRLAAIMRAERLRDLDSSWLLFGPETEEGGEQLEDYEPLKYAAE